MLKRSFDLLVSLVVLLVFLPIILLIAVVLYSTMGGIVLFRQQRPGYLGHTFEMVKFVTMTNAKDEKGALLPDGDRLTAVGRFLRDSSLDELPELWNVIKGDMSLVGPRPLLVEYMELYTDEQARRHDVLPGITGWAQVNGRNTISWDKKLKLDVWYVDNRSFWLDIKILGLTFQRVLSRKGINQVGHPTSEKFKGQGTDE